MALPAQVEKDLKEIEELEKQLYAPDGNEDKPEEGESPAAETKEVVEDPKSEQETDEQPQEKPESQEVETPQAEDFEHKYRTLRGKYDAEVPRLHDQVKELTTKLGDLSAKLEEKPKTPEPEPEPLVTDADRENFGEDLLDVQRRVAQDVGSKYESQIKRLESTIEDLTKRLDGTNNSMSELTFEQRLGRLVPDFETVNKDPKWISWLDGIDPMVRGPRRLMAQQAFAKGDAEAVADYVKLFKEAIAPAQTQQSKSEAELEKQVTPSRTTTPANPQQTNQKPTYNEAQLNSGWDRVTVLNKAGRYDEADKLEAELSTAMLEGRAPAF